MVKRVTPAEADALMKDLGDHCAAFESDLSSSENSRALVDAVVRRFGRLDSLVVNHGVWPAEDIGIDRMPEAQWRNTLAINLESVFGLIKYSVAQMKKQIKALTTSLGKVSERIHLGHSLSQVLVSNEAK